MFSDSDPATLSSTDTAAHFRLSKSSDDNDGVLSADELECYNYVQEYDDDVFAVELQKGEHGLGLGLIDGLVSFNLSLVEKSLNQ